MHPFRTTQRAGSAPRGRSPCSGLETVCPVSSYLALDRHILARTHPMRSGNPALKDSTFLDLGSGTVVSRAAGGAMTLNGTVGKTAILLVLAVMTAAFAWSKVAITPDGMTGGLYRSEEHTSELQSLMRIS